MTTNIYNIKQDLVLVMLDKMMMTLYKYIKQDEVTKTNTTIMPYSALFLTENCLGLWTS